MFVLIANPLRAMRGPLPVTLKAVPEAVPNGPSTLVAPVEESRIINLSCSTRSPYGECTPLTPDTLMIVSLAFSVTVVFVGPVAVREVP